jgi:UDP-2-acetamido-2-deoxy-ribo-hexuluronate aminotransferase
MEFIDLRTQQQRIRTQLDRNIARVLDHGRYVMGPEIDELEERLARFAGVRRCIAVSSGTDALLIALMALDVGPGDEVITTPFTFAATAEMIALVGARPVYVDIEPGTWNIDAGAIEAAVTPRTRAIMPVSLYGQCADMDAINAIAAAHGLPVIEDGAQSFGATYKGHRSCALSTIGCTSFFPSKPLGGYGDGGACFTDDLDLDQVMRSLRNHGQEGRYHHVRIGINGRMDTLQAAVLLAKLDIFEDEIERRIKVGTRYSALFERFDGAIETPVVAASNTCVYAQYTIQVDDRDAVACELGRRGIPTAVHYPVSLHRQPAFERTGSTLPVSDRAAQRVLSLPMHPYLAESDQETVVDATRAALSAVASAA